MFLSTNSLSIVYTFPWEYISLSSHIVVCPLFNMWGEYVILVISVDLHSYFTGIALLIIPTTNTTQNFTIAWKKWNRTQRTLNNKQFNMHITEYENKQNTWCVNGLLENKVWQENKFV